MRGAISLALAVTVMTAGCVDGVFDQEEADAETLDLLRELATFPEWRIETDQGPIRMVLYTGWLPQTTSNIIRVTEEGYYTDTTVYRVIDDFVIQGGDEEESDAEVLIEGEGLPLETKDGLDFGSGSVGLARLGQDDGTAHYFITEKPQLHLSRPERSSTGAVFGEYALFGQVFEGQGLVRTLAEVETDANDRPVEDIVVHNASVLDPPRDADLLNLVPDVIPDVSTQGHAGVFEHPRVLVTDHPAHFLFTSDNDDSDDGEGPCTVDTYGLRGPTDDPDHDEGHETTYHSWQADPQDPCTFHGTIIFDEPGDYVFDLGHHDIPLEVLPWHKAYAPFTGTAIEGA